MNRLTDNDTNLGPLTIARWHRSFAAYLETGDDEDPGNRLMLIAFGRALRIVLPPIIAPQREKKIASSWDEQTIERLGRNWYYDVFERRFGFSLSDMGNGYDFLQVFFGPQTHDSKTTKSWCSHLPWKQWNCVRNSVYEPTGELYATEVRGEFFEFMRAKEECPACHFGFEDFDGEMIVASCVIEEREWHRGEGWFKWLKWLHPRKIQRSLDLKFSAEVGPEKGSWKGGTTGHGIDMQPGETPRMAFERYCGMEHDARQGRKFRIRFIGPFGAPSKPVPITDGAEAHNAQEKEM